MKKEMKLVQCTVNGKEVAFYIVRYHYGEEQATVLFRIA